MSSKQEFRVRDLSTRSVLIFPTRAQIVRDIRDITLQTGTNQIIIDGLAPTIDEHSIKVEGNGSATITEVSVDLLPNRDVYEEVYSSDSELEEETDDDSSDSEDESMKLVDTKIKQVNRLLAQENEKINSVASRLKICEDYGATVRDNPPSPEQFEKLMKAYRDEREKIYVEHVAATAALEVTQDEIVRLMKEKSKLTKARTKAQRKTFKQKIKLQATKSRKNAESAKEKLRIKSERSLFWPKKVYRVTISIEPTSSAMISGSSRPSSVASDMTVNNYQVSSRRATDIISLSISYITYEVSWSPRYDLSLNTLTSTGVLEYAAELKNMTSETWRDAKVLLSTSQTSITSFNESIPTLPHGTCDYLKEGVEMPKPLFLVPQPRYLLFGFEPTNNPFQNKGGFPSNNIFGNAPAHHKQNFFPPVAGFGSIATSQGPSTESYLYWWLIWGPAPSQNPASSGGLFGSLRTATTNIPESVAENSASQPAQGNSLLGSVQPPEHGANFSTPGSDMGDPSEAIEGPLIQRLLSPKPTLTFEEGAWEESGMSTTYDLPGLKTLMPSNSVLKHKIAKIEFKNIGFEHVVIPKLRTVAFLKAKLRNSSKIPLLAGPVGLNLDGSFLGQATFPRCSVGESLSLNLGVDPAIKVVYNKPEVRRSQSGIFSKEDSNVFLRSLSLRNTRIQRGVSLLVMDQVPVSEEERLRVEVLVPRGLKPDGDRIPTGLNLDDEMLQGGRERERDRDRERTSSSGELKKSGEVLWNVRLAPGAGVKLVLQYEAGFPSGETVVNA
ncbi:mucoidy inhibitor-like protein [Botrytis cinerea]